MTLSKVTFQIVSLLIVTLLFSSSCTYQSDAKYKATEIESGGDYKIFTTSDYKTLIGSSVDIYVSVGTASDTIKLDADPSILDKILVINKEGCLSITDHNLAAEKVGKRKARAYISVDTLDEIYATLCNIYLEKPLNSEEYEVTGKIIVDSLAVVGHR